MDENMYGDIYAGKLQHYFDLKNAENTSQSAQNGGGSGDDTICDGADNMMTPHNKASVNDKLKKYEIIQNICYKKK